MKKRRNRGIESLKSRYGFMFVTPWTIGIIIFFLVPLVQSIIYSFNEVTVTSKGIKFKFAGLSNYKDILFTSPLFMNTFLNPHKFLCGIYSYFKTV